MSSPTESAPKQIVFDVRTVERNIKKGHTTRKEYEKYLKALPDVSANVAPPEEDELDDDLEDDDTDGDETDDAPTDGAP